jgi:hypothetical protein
MYRQCGVELGSNGVGFHVDGIGVATLDGVVVVVEKLRDALLSTIDVPAYLTIRDEFRGNTIKILLSFGVDGEEIVILIRDVVSPVLFVGIEPLIVDMLHRWRHF